MRLCSCPPMPRSWRLRGCLGVSGSRPATSARAICCLQMKTTRGWCRAISLVMTLLTPALSERSPRRSAWGASGCSRSKVATWPPTVGTPEILAPRCRWLSRPLAAVGHADSWSSCLARCQPSSVSVPMPMPMMMRGSCPLTTAAELIQAPNSSAGSCRNHFLIRSTTLSVKTTWTSSRTGLRQSRHLRLGQASLLASTRLRWRRRQTSQPNTPRPNPAPQV